jgi:hypothetical protein
MSNASNDLVLHLKLDTIIPDGGNQRVRSALTENFLASSENVSAFTESQYRSHGNPQFVSDEHFGSCFIFDGRQDYIEIPNSEDINFATNQDFTVASWIKIAKEQPFKTNGDNDIIEKWNGSRGYPYVIRYMRDSQTIHAARYDGSNNPSITTTTKLNSEQFYHIAFVKEGRKLRLYLDGGEENSTDDTTQSQTQNDSPLYLACRGGSNEAYANYFAGTIAHLRIYNKALSPEEIKRDMNDDLTVIAAFNLAYPLDFNLYEGEDQKSVIFIENDTKGEELVFEIQNDTEKEINLPAKSGAVTQNNYHFELRFRPDTLSPKSLQQLALKTQSNWSMSSPVTQADGIVSLYFLTTNTTLSANEVVTLTLPNVSASAAGGARTTRVEFLCPEFTYQGETLTHYYREKKLSVIDHRGKKNIPLHVSFVGSNRILNDGTTTNKLTLQIVNVLKDKSIPLIPDSKGDNASKFIISFDVQEEGQNKDWALGTTSQVAGISIKYKAKEIINSGQQGESPEWVILFNDQTAIEPSQDIQVELSGIVSSLAAGQTNLYIRYENIPGYWDGTFVCTIEKSPIVFDTNGNVGIGISNPGNFKLNVQGGDTQLGDLQVTGIISGGNSIGGNAASIQGYGTGGNQGVFAFKYDKEHLGDNPNAIQIWNSSSGVFKTFIIDHPLDHQKYLVHATLEGPEGGVYYRGTARLNKGRVEVHLPHYFESLTSQKDRTITLTNINGFDRIAVEKFEGMKIKDGVFVVVSENPESIQEFDWEVKAVRADIPTLKPEPHKHEIKVSGFGPYTFAVN